MTEQAAFTTPLIPSARSESGCFENTATARRRLLKTAAQTPRRQAGRHFLTGAASVQRRARFVSQMLEPGANWPDLS